MQATLRDLQRWWPLVAVTVLLLGAASWYVQSPRPDVVATVSSAPQLRERWEADPLLHKMRTRVRQTLQPWQGKRIELQDVYSNLKNDPVMVLAAIVNQRLFLDESVSGSQQVREKLSGWFEQLSAVLHQLEEHGLHVPDCMFTLHLRSLPKHTAANPPAAPSLALASSPQHAEVPMPNPYFMPPKEWGKVFRQLCQLAKTRPFDKRRPIALYRGACRLYPGSLTRVQLAAIRDPALDARLTQKCYQESWSKADPADQALLARARYAKFSTFSKYVKYKYLIHMPGAIGGSYSRNLQFILGLGGVVLIWDHPYFEFYYDWLKEGTHFISVNATNIVSKIAELNANPDRAAAMAMTTQTWFKRHLHPDFLLQYWWALLTEYASMQNFEPTLADLKRPCTCRYAHQEYRGKQCSVCKDDREPYKLGMPKNNRRVSTAR